MKPRNRMWPSFVFVLMLALVACGDARLSFAEYTLTKCGLVVQLPGEPTEEKQSAETPNDIMDATLYAVSAGNSEYQVSCNNFPADMMTAANVNRILDYAVQTVMNNVGATLDSQMIIELDGNPGLDIEGSAKIRGQDAVVRARVYLVGNRLIQTQVMGIRGQLHAADTAKYLASLKLL